MGAWAWAFWLCGAACGIIGMVLLVRVVTLKRAPGRVCRGCGYDMAGSSGLRCSECGRVARSERELGRRRWNVRLALAGVLCVLLGIAVAWTPRVRERGWLGATPTLVLAVGARVQGEWTEEMLGEINRRVPKDGKLGVVISRLILPRILEEPPELPPRDSLVGSDIRDDLVEALDRETLDGALLRRLAWDAPAGQRYTAIVVMNWHDPSPRVRKRLAEIALDRDDPFQQEAVARLGKLPREEAFPVVVRLLNDAASAAGESPPQPDRDKTAMYAISRFWPEDHVDAESLEALWRLVRARPEFRPHGLLHLLRLDPARIDEICALCMDPDLELRGESFCWFTHVLGVVCTTPPKCLECLFPTWRVRLTQEERALQGRSEWSSPQTPLFGRHC